jgi:hypothetical protein
LILTRNVVLACCSIGDQRKLSIAYRQRLFERDFPVKSVTAEGGAFDRKIPFDPFAAVAIDGPERPGKSATDQSDPA